jgi:membrane protease subunit HflK
VREVVGARTMDQVLSGEGRSEIETLTGEHVQAKLDDYRTGLIITDVNMQEAKAPEEVKSAFDDAIKAREDEQRLINEAQAYSNEVIPKSRGGAARVIEEAKGYKSQVIAEAEGETSRFGQILSQYERAPQVTRERLYLETMEQVLGGSVKVVMTSGKGASNLMYLPLDKLLERGAVAAPAATAQATQEVQAVPGGELERRDRQDYRARDLR